MASGPWDVIQDCGSDSTAVLLRKRELRTIQGELEKDPSKREVFAEFVNLDFGAVGMTIDTATSWMLQFWERTSTGNVLEFAHMKVAIAEVKQSRKSEETLIALKETLIALDKAKSTADSNAQRLESRRRNLDLLLALVGFVLGAFSVWQTILALEANALARESLALSRHSGQVHK